MISKIYFDQKSVEHYNFENDERSLSNINRLNIFIGANNSGKSRFLRTLFSDRNFKIKLFEDSFTEIAEVFKLILDEVTPNLNRLGFEDIGSQYMSNIKATLSEKIRVVKKIDLNNINTIATEIFSFWEELKEFKATNSTLLDGRYSSGDFSDATNLIQSLAKKYNSKISSLLKDDLNYSPERIYIPILRGLRPTQLRNEDRFDEVYDNYCKRTIRDYFKDSSIKKEEIFTGLRLYEDVKKMLLGKRDERIKIRKFESFLSKTFFNNETVTLIPNIEDDSLHVSIGEEERAIYELGDGIQSIIILLYPLFFNQGKNMLVFIEEPENSLHPGLQRLLIETMMLDMFNSFQYFITTHSNHFLDLTLEVSKTSIFTFKKNITDSQEDIIYEIKNSSNDNNNLLSLIGARNSSIFLSNCTIWVEGITDRLYLKKYLEVYQDSLPKKVGISRFMEDLNFSFIEYGGSNISHWSFEDEAAWNEIRANRINSKIFLIADKDSTASKPNSKKAERLASLQQLFGDNFQITTGKEIENILQPDVLIATIKDMEKENFSQISYNKKHVQSDKYLKLPLGTFIKTTFKGIKRKYDAKSGTIYCKLDFCRTAINNIKTIKDLSNDALNLTEKIYNFIVLSNE